MKKFLRRLDIRLVISFVVLLVSSLFILILSNAPVEVLKQYQNVSKWLMNLLSSSTGFVSFSLWDIFLCIIFVDFLVVIIKRLKKKQSIGSLACTLVLIVSLLASLVLVGWMGNHYNEKLSVTLDYDQGEYSLNDLYQSCCYYMDKAQQLANEIVRNDDNIIEGYDIETVGQIAGKAYQNLEGVNDVFIGSSQPVKYLTLTSKIYLYNNITGIFMPFSGEANVCKGVYDITLPFTMCHEAAHRLAIASEQDCNFAAFLACINNDDGYFQYSGYYCAFRYCFNSLRMADNDLALKLIDEVRDKENYNLVIEDYNNQITYYQQFDSFMNEVGDKVNDTYLKLFSQDKGTLSYGMVSDDLVHYYLQLLGGIYE